MCRHRCYKHNLSSFYRWSYSADGTSRGYVRFTLARFNVTGWSEFEELFPNVDHCYYRDFRGQEHQAALWWQLMLARLVFFASYVVIFLLVQWLCDLLVPSVPSSVKRSQQRADYLAHKVIYKFVFSVFISLFSLFLDV